MPLPMQGNKLLPRQQNVGRRRFMPRAPDRRRGDGALDARQKRAETEALELGDKLGTLRHACGFAGICRVLTEIARRMMGEHVDQRAFELLRVGMAELGLGEFLHVVVQQPGMIEGGLQYQRLAERDRGAMAAMQRACRKLRAGGDVSFVAEGGLRRSPPARRAAAAAVVVEAVGAEILPARRTVVTRKILRREHLPKPRRKILPVIA